ncbi:MAG: hypothetical protein M3Y33_03830 [Actinomycetota bacterium]|nr:hypothetical protein [Actinomycetota bacterium]
MASGAGSRKRPNGATPARPRASAARVSRLDQETGTGLGPAAQADALAKLKADAEEVAARELQMDAEGLSPANSVELKGERFRVSAGIGGMALMKFASVADQGVVTTDFRALAAMYSLLKSCIDEGAPPCGECTECLSQPGAPNPACPDYDPGEWGRFEQHAMEARSTPDDLFEVVKQAMVVIAARPTPQP